MSAFPSFATATLMTCASVCCLVCAGCAPAPAPAPAAKPAAASHDHDHDHDHADDKHDHDPDHDKPASFADGIAKLESLAEDLADKLADNAGEAADDAVHGIGHLLEEVRGLAEKEGFEGAAAAAATKALDEVEECFGKVDEAFHSGNADADPATVLGAVKERLEAAFKVLRSKGVEEVK